MVAASDPGGVLHVGLEHEFRVSSLSIAVDFRSLIHGLALGQPNLDPADPNAYRLPSGAAATCDGAEAEIALPPTPVRSGFAFEVAGRAQAERTGLRSRLANDLQLSGCSTHLSVSVPDALTQAVCQLYATTFAPGLMLLMDRHESPGLLIRPRPGRVELGGEFIDGEPLVAAMVFAVGSVLACRDALVSAVRREQDPPQLEVRVEPATQRFGWYVDRTAFGDDLYSCGRSTLLRTTSGEPLLAQTHLERSWEAAEGALAGLAAPDELALVRDVIAGARPLPTERLGEAETLPAATVPLVSSPYGRALASRRRPAFEIAPVMLTWELAVFVIRRSARLRFGFAAVPGSRLGPFLDALDRGALDGTITAYLDRRRRGRRLESRAQTGVPALFDELGPRRGLLAAEFDRGGAPVPAIARGDRRFGAHRWRPTRLRRPGAQRPTLGGRIL